LIVTSDHGELIERGISGHNTPVLYEPLLHIPLLISYPHQQNAQVIHAATHAADLLPSLLQLTGVDIPQDLNGEILPRQPEQNPTARDLLISEAKSSPKQGALRRGTFALVRDRYKLIYYRGYSGFDNVFELYDLGNDPEEIEDIYSEQDPLSTDMKASLLKHLEGYL
jgi:arylsulfatase A-like enzyme